LIAAQDISLQYVNQQGNTTSNMIKKDTKEIIIEDQPNLTKFTVIVNNLATNHKIILLDPDDEEIGTYSTSGAVQSFTSGTALNNKKLTVIYVDDKNVRTVYATVAVLNKLPVSQLDVTNQLTAWMAGTKKVCDPCKYAGNALEYDLASNSLDYKDRIVWSKKFKFTNGRPLVGKPFTFSIKNVNPFRDSVIISSATQNYNTEVPELFTKAFFSPGKTVGAATDEAKILADVLALGEQIETITIALKNSKECENICQIIQQTKDAIEKHFQNVYKFDPTKQELVSFLADRLQKINAAYKEKVSKIINDYRNFYNARDYVDYNIIQIENVDEYIFTLSVVPKSGAQLYRIIDKQPVSVLPVGGFKFDFSSGLFVTGLRDQRFTLRPDSTVIQNSFGGDSIVYNRRNEIIQQSEGKKVDFGVSALMHFYPRITPNVNLGLSLGAGLSIGPDPSIRYLGGVSLLLGKSGRFILTYGCAAGYVNVLADGYQNLQFTSLSDKNTMTKKSFKTRGFWGLTFNIPLFKSKVNTDEAKPEEKKEEESKEEQSKEDEKK
jgi:hypothetical protein